MTLLLIPCVLLFFLLGAVLGSFLNVCIYRIPYEKSIIWPGSFCGHCFQPIRWYDNLPLLSYWLLRGRCRKCGAPFSARYFVIELLTGLAWALVFYLEVVANWHGIRVFDQQAFFISWGVIPWQGLVFVVYHGTLLSFLIVATFTDLDHMEIPLPVTVTGMLVGLIGSTLFPWPWPSSLADVLPPFWRKGEPPLLGPGLYPWPVWYPLPDWLPAGSWRLGLATGLAGVVAGAVVLRAIGFLFKVARGKEGLGLGDADLMMLVGAFLGWQPVLVAFFVAVIPGLVFGLLHLAFRGDKPMPFGPSLAMGAVFTLLGWHWIGPRVYWLFFDSVLLTVLGGGFLVGLVVIFGMLRLVRGTDQPEAPAAAGPPPPSAEGAPATPVVAGPAPADGDGSPPPPPSGEVVPPPERTETGSKPGG
jgi:leader peptidase (prepilin peptidase) / N-methyltransferase